MLIGSIGSRNIVTRYGMIGRGRQGASQPRGSSSAQRLGVRDFMSRVVAAGNSVQRLQERFGTLQGGTGRSIAASRIGGSTVGLNTAGTSSTLTSSEGISSLTTLVEDRSPSWSKSTSTAEVSVHGTYTGTVDAEYTLKSGYTKGFDVGSAGTYALRVWKNGVRVTPNITIPPGYTEGTELTVELGSGLSISLTEDKISKLDELTIQARAGVDATADANAAFDGSSGYPAGLDSAVISGSFEINGTTISVAADDSIQTVLDTINSSGAGVVAAYNATDDTLSLTHSSGGAHDIVVGNDTSGFVAAMKLDTASVDLGVGDERDLAIADVAALAGISSGSFRVNGVTIAVDVTTDSLSDLISRVKDSGAEAVMTYSASSDRLSFRSTSSGSPLTVDNDTTGLFATFGIESGETEARSTQGTSQRVIDAVTEQLAEMVELLNELAGTGTYESLIHDGASHARDQLRTAIREGFGGQLQDTLDTGFGLVFDVAEDSSRPFATFSKAGEHALADALRNDPQATLKRLFGSKTEDGLMGNILNGLDRAQHTVTGTYGSVGFLLNTSA